MKPFRQIIFIASIFTLFNVVNLLPNTAYAIGGTGGLGESCRAGSPRCDAGLECTSSFGAGTCFQPTPTPGGGGGGSCRADGIGCLSGSECCSGSCTASCYDTGYGEQCFCGSGGGGSTPTPTTGGGGGGSTSTPTPTSITYSITGNVFIDSNNNGVQNCSGACNNGSGDEPGYGGATVILSGAANRSTTSDSAGSDKGLYTFSNLSSGTYTITLTLPAGYGLTTPGSRTRTLGPSASGVNFGISNTIPPSCTSVSGPTTINSGQSASITANSCAPNPTYSWPTPGIIPPQCSDGTDNNGNSLIDTNDPACHSDGNPGNPGSYQPNNPEGGSGGSNTGGSSSTTTYTAPTVCTPITARQSVVVSNGNGSTIYNKDMTVNPRNTVTGSVLIDTGGNNCSSGSTSYGSFARVTLYRGATQTVTGLTSGGTYNLADTAVCGDRTAVLSSVPGYTVKAARFDGGAWDSTNLSGYTYGAFDLSSNHTLDFCISNNSAWIQTTTGDVRFNQIPYSIPSGRVASTDATNPSVFFSSGTFPWAVGSGTASSGGGKWTVNTEYSYDDGAKNANGGASYSFYKSRASQKNVTLQRFAGCPAGVGNCTITSATNIPTGVYFVDGNLTISSYTQVAGAHVLILVNGTTTINNNITVANNQSNLLIIASKGNMTISASGVSGSTQSIQGIFTSEGDIIAAGTQCAGGFTADKALAVQGVLVANARKPLALNGAGSLVNNRSLCLLDQLNPSITVAQRLDFVIQLTDFYKTSITRFQEINP